MSQPIHQQTPAQTSPPQSAGVLQRKCRTCGQHTLARDLCDNCRQAGSGTASAVSLADALSIQPVALSAESRGADLSHIPVSRTTTPVIQAKLTVSQPGDKYEQEADRVAEEVVRRMNNPPSEPLQRQPLPSEEDKQLYRKPAAQSPISFLHPLSAGDGLPISPSLETAIQHARGSGESLPDEVRMPIEQAFGADFSGVRVHRDAESERLNRLLSAHAFTTGQDIFLRQGIFNSENHQSQKLLAHELTHVVQQTGISKSASGLISALASRSLIIQRSGFERTIMLPSIFPSLIGETSGNPSEIKVITMYFDRREIHGNWLIYQQNLISPQDPHNPDQLQLPLDNEYKIELKPIEIKYSMGFDDLRYLLRRILMQFIDNRIPLPPLPFVSRIYDYLSGHLDDCIDAFLRNTNNPFSWKQDIESGARWNFRLVAPSDFSFLSSQIPTWGAASLPQNLPRFSASIGLFPITIDLTDFSSLIQSVVLNEAHVDPPTGTSFVRTSHANLNMRLEWVTQAVSVTATLNAEVGEGVSVSGGLEFHVPVMEQHPNAEFVLDILPIAPSRLPEETTVLTVDFPVDGYVVNSKQRTDLRGWYQNLPDDIRRGIEGGYITVTLHGYCSPTGPEAHNDSLAGNRIMAVVGQLSNCANLVPGVVNNWRQYPHGRSEGGRQEDPSMRRVDVIIPVEITSPIAGKHFHIPTSWGAYFGSELEREIALGGN